MNISRELTHRVARLKKTLCEKSVKTFLVTQEHNVKYLSGVDTGRAVVSAEEAVLWVRKPYDKVYKEIFESKNYPLKLRVYDRGCIKKYLGEHKATQVYVDDVSVSSWRRMKKALDCELVLCDFLEKQRCIKSAYEIGCLKKSAHLAKSAMQYAENIIGGDKTESEAAAEIEAFIRERGSMTPPFGQGMLLASGKSSANIHAKPQQKKIRKMTVADLGAVVDDYHSDMTRTFYVGRPSKTEKRMLQLMENIELCAIDRIKPNVTVEEIASYIDKRLKRHKLSLAHAAGHGVGLQIHEAPYIGGGSEDVFKRDMVFTIEPGIYLPNRFGVRFEDTILLKNKSHILTR